MRVLFVGIGSEQLNISLLASILRRSGHHVGLAFSRHLFDDKDSVCMPALASVFNDDHDTLAEARRFRPDVVCYSALTVTYQWMLAMAQRLKHDLGVVNVFGGVHASAVPHVVLEEPAVDFVCIGEADYALPLLLERIANGPVTEALPNVAYRSPKGAIVQGGQMPFVRNLDLLPPFEKDLWEDTVPLRDGYLTMSSRGCPYRCTFCFNNFFANLGGTHDAGASYVRQRSVDHFLNELKAARRRYAIRYIHILDDIFTIDVTWLRRFATRYRKEIGVPFQCLTHAHFVDAERVEALREAGCVWTQLGVQSIDDDYKKHTLRRSDKAVRIERALDLLHAAGIATKTDHIFGLPGETLDSQDRALAFYRKHASLRRISTYWLTYLPGTEMVDQGVAQGTITPAQVDALNRGETTFWHRERNVQDPALRSRYQQFEMAFRLLPYLPVPFRKRLERKHLAWIPTPLLKPLGLVPLLADLFLTVDVRVLGARYVFGIVRHVAARLGVRASTAPVRELAPLNDATWRTLFDRARTDGASEAPERPAAPPEARRRVRLPVREAS